MRFDLIGRRRPVLFFNDDPGGGGGGGGGGDPAGGGGGDPSGGGGGRAEDLQAQIDKAVEEATSGLKRKNDDLIRERRDAKSRLEEATKTLEGLGGEEGVARLVQLQQSLMKDELGRLLAEGKHEEWHEKKTKALRADHENQLQTLQEALDVKAKEVDAVSLRLRRKNLETDVHNACSACGVIDSARSDVLLYADTVFTEHEDYPGRLVIVDENEGVVFGKDGKTPKTMAEWLEDQKAERRHWFPASKGADAASNLHGGERAADLSEIAGVTDWREKRKKLGMKSGFGSDIP